MTLGYIVPDDALTEREVARVLEVPVATLRSWRLAGLLRNGLVRGKMSDLRTAPMLYWRAGVEAARELADPLTAEDVGGIFRRDVVAVAVWTAPPAPTKREAAPRGVTWHVPKRPGRPPRGAATESESASDTVPDEVPDTAPRMPTVGVSY